MGRTVNFAKLFSIFAIGLALNGCAATQIDNTCQPFAVGDEPQMLAYSLGGKAYVSLGKTSDKQMMLSFSGKQSSGLLMVGLDHDGEPSLALMSNEKGPWLTLGFAKNGRPIIALTGEDGAARMLLSADGKDAAKIVFLGKKSMTQEGSTPRAYLGISSLNGRDYPVLSLEAAEHGAKITASLAGNEQPILEIINSQGQTRLSMGVGDDGAGFIRLLDDQGAVVWEAR